MLIEVRKAGFVNKGAELMLLSVLDRVRREMPEAMTAMAPDLRTAPYIKRASLGLYQKIWFQRYRVQWGFLGATIPRAVREFFGLVLDKEIDAVLDASGFSYSDQVGLSSTLAAAKAVKRWKRRGTKVILLPQAFGPFENSRIRSSMLRIVRDADLIFARDEVSYGHLTGIDGEKEHIGMAPDFTCLLRGRVPESFDQGEDSFCMIPNHRMLEKTSSGEAAGYLDFLGRCCSYINKRGGRLFFLIHEGGKDHAIARKVIDGLGSDVPVITEDDPVMIKGILGTCRGVISSRYHGLVSSLSQGIPALAVGWSHKYEMLFRDYGFTEGLLQATSPASDIESRIDMLIDRHSREDLSSVLLEKAQQQKDLTEEMWESVFSVLRK